VPGSLQVYTAAAAAAAAAPIATPDAYWAAINTCATGAFT